MTVWCVWCTQPSVHHNDLEATEGAGQGGASAQALHIKGLLQTSIK